MVLKRGVEGSVTRVADAKVAVFSQGVDTSSTETKVGGLGGRVGGSVGGWGGPGELGGGAGGALGVG